MSSGAGRDIVLWVSRHELLPAQRRALEKLYPNATILQYSGNVACAEELKAFVDKVKPVAVLSQSVNLEGRIESQK